MFCGAKLQRIFELCKSSTKKLPKFAYKTKVESRKRNRKCANAYKNKKKIIKIALRAENNNYKTKTKKTPLRVR